VKISGSYTLDAPRQEVWDALNDIDVLARIVPGCQRLEQTGDNEFEGTIKVGIQAIKGTYNGRIRLQDVRAPEHYKLVAHGSGSNGVVDGVGAIDLTEEDGKTILKYSGDANIGGTLASVGQRLIDGASKQLLNQSLKALAEQVAKRAAGEPVVEAPAGAPVSPPQPAVASPAAAALSTEPAVATSVAATAAAPDTATENGVAHPHLTQPPEPPQHPLPSAAPAPPTRRTVTLSESEQLKPESVMKGIVDDYVAERPWLPWVIVAFLLGYLFGRARG
jgi:hypothetical protein